MAYYVETEDGNRYGPAEPSQLSQWAAEGRLKPEWIAVDAATGARAPLHTIIVFTGSANPTNPASGSTGPDSTVIGSSPAAATGGQADPFSGQGVGQTTNISAGGQAPSWQGGAYPNSAQPNVSQQFMVIHPNGKLYGPISAADLYVWLQQGRVLPNWLVSDAATKQQMTVTQALSASQQGYVQYPRSPYASSYRSPNPWARPSQVCGIVAIVFTLTICLFEIGFIAGIVSITFGILANKLEPKSGRTGISLGIASIIIGVLLYALSIYVKNIMG